MWREEQASTVVARLAELAPLLLVLVGVALLIAGIPAGAAVLVILGVGIVVAGRQVGSPLRLAARIGGRAVDPVHEARLVNVTDSLCASLGVAQPELRVLEDPAPNAIVIGVKPSTAVLVCTTGLLSILDRLELEGLVAHELSHVKRGDLVRAVAAVRASALLALVSPASAGLVRKLAGAERESLADLRAVRATRYPPGLAAALEKLAEAPTVRPAGLDRLTARLTGALWCAPLTEELPTAAFVGVLHVDERAAALREL